MIKDVEVISLFRRFDERGYFMEIARDVDIFRFGQWSVSYMYTGVIKAWHIHQIQTDYWFVPFGNIKAALWQNGETQEYLMGDGYNPIMLKIPPGVAHGLKVLQGPAMLSYITSHIYDPGDEGRIPYNSSEIGYDWHKEVIT